MNMRADSFLTNAINGQRNKLTGYGQPGCDQATGFDVNPVVNLQRQVLDNIYRTSTIYRKIADMLPQDAGKKEWDITQGSTRIANRNIQRVKDKLKELDIYHLFVNASKWARLYNNAYIILGIEDGLSPVEPVDMDRVRGIRFAIVRDSEDINAHYLMSNYDISHYEMTLGDQNQEEFEELFPGSIVQGRLQIHPSRVLDFSGLSLPPKAKRDNAGCDDSLIQAIYTDVANYAQGIGAGSQMLVRSGLAVFKMSGLVDYAESNNTSALANRFQFLNAGLSVFKSMFLDSSPDLNESIEYVNQNFAGADKMVEQLINHLVIVSGYPRSVLLGSSNANAFSEGGESDRREWARVVSTYQSNEWQRHAEYVVKLCLNGLNVRDTTNVSVDFPSIYEPTQEEQAALQSLYKDQDTAYVNAGILSKEEVRTSRFADPDFTDTITLIPGSLEAEQQAEQENELNMEKERIAMQPTPTVPPGRNN